MKKSLSILGSSVALALSMGVAGSASAVEIIADGTVLNFTSGVGSCEAGGTFPSCTYGASTVATGSYFIMDTKGDGFDNWDRIALPAVGVGAITIGTPEARGTFDAGWMFGGNPGDHYTQGDDGLDTNGISSTLIGDATAGAHSVEIDMSGWTVWWGDVDAGTDGPINMGAGANAILTCGALDCAVGDTFELNYSAIVPSGGFTGFGYGLYLTGTIATSVLAPVPVPAAVWLFGSGLLGLVGVARRRKVAY